MPELWLVPGLVFGAVLLGVEAIYWLVFQPRHINRAVERRLQASRQGCDEAEASTALRDAAGLLESAPVFRGLNDFIAQSGLRPGSNRLLLAVGGLSLSLFFVWGLLLGRGAGAAAAAFASALLLVFLFFRNARRRRIARFAELLPDTLDVIVRAVRVGYPLPTAIDLVAREMPDPVGSEFRAVAEEIAFGQDVRSAIENLYRRVGQDDLLFFIVAVNVQYQTGGNLAEILSGLARLIRQRARLRLKISALSAEGRVSALVLSVMPFILFIGISLISPGYFGEVRHHPLVAPALVYAAISLLVGNIVMYRMVNFKF